MFAVIETGGKQYRVSAKDKLTIESLHEDVGAKIVFDKLCLLGDGASIIEGESLANAKVLATVVAHDRDDKIVIFKKKRRKGYRRKGGHRQHHTVVLIDAIEKGS